MPDIKAIVEEIMSKNMWLNGMYDFKEGDLMAILNQSEKFNSITEFDDLQKLHETIKQYDGVFKYKNLLFFRDWKYGVFVYDITDEDREHYVEHLDHDIEYDKFVGIVKGLIKEG